MPLPPFDVSEQDSSDLNALSRAAKDHIIEALGGVCSYPGCLQRATFRTVKTCYRPEGATYKRYVIRQYCNLEMDHVTPVQNNNYEWRLGNLHFAKRGSAQWQAYMDHFLEEAEDCRLRCRKHHQRYVPAAPY